MSLADDIAEVRTIASEGYKAFMKSFLIYTDFRSDNDLLDQDQVENATLGEPFRLSTLPAESINTYKTGISLDSLTTVTDVYLFPVLFNGVIKLFLEVSKSETDTFEINSLGQGWFANEIINLLSRYPSSAGYSLNIVLNDQLHKYLVHVPEVSRDNLTIITPNQDYSTLSHIDETIDVLKVELNELYN